MDAADVVGITDNALLRADDESRKMRLLFVTSFAMAISAFLGPRLVSSDYAIYASLLLDICWFFLLVAGLLAFKRRGFWLLIGLPLVLYWPVGLWLLASACHHNIKACP
jgi:hypothetical protein